MTIGTWVKDGLRLRSISRRINVGFKEDQEQMNRAIAAIDMTVVDVSDRTFKFEDVPATM